MKKFEETMSSIYEKVNKKKAQNRRQRIVFLSSLFSLSLMVVVAVAIFNNMEPENSDTPFHTVLTENSETLLRGLAVDNYKLSDIQTGNLADRMAASKLCDFFSYYSPDFFVYAKVIDTVQYEDKSNDYCSLKQTSSVQVIGELWSNHADVPDTLTIIQSLNGGCMGDEKTNLLRKDGVYLLPLIKDVETGQYYVCYDLDVLWEVDNEGKIWSHSEHEKLNCYDGKDTSVLTNVITQMTSDENFDSAISPLGKMIRNWGDIGVLAEVQVASVETAKDEWENDCWKYSFSEFKPLITTNKKNIGAISFTDNSKTLGVGSNSLLMLDYSEDSPYLDNIRVAKINDNGTISPMDSAGDNIFAAFDGYTVKQIKVEAEKAKLWNEQYGEK